MPQAEPGNLNFTPYLLSDTSSKSSPQTAQLLVDFLANQASTLTPAKFLALELILLHATRQDLAERILGRLARAESRETDPWAQDDIRVAWKAVLYAALGYPDPWGYAFWDYYGKTLPKALVAWAERDRLIASELRRCEQMVAAASLPPKKPNHIIRKIFRAMRKERAA